MGGVQLHRHLPAHGNFRLLPAGDGLLLSGDYSRQMQRLAATRVFMLKLFYFISDMVPC